MLTKKVLFFTPYGTLTGSEVLLWNLLKHYDRQQFKAALYCNDDGQLLASLPVDIPCFTSPFRKKGLRSLIAKMLHYVGVPVYKRAVRRIHNHIKPDCWYLNTILMFHLVPLAQELGVKTIVHINELNSLYESISYDEMAFAMKHADVTVGITEQICTLATAMGAQRVMQQDCFVDTEQQFVDMVRVSELKTQLGIKSTDFVWIMVGTPIYRKGIDFLPDIASHFASQPCHFIWMGNTKRTGLTYLVEKQIETYGLTNVSFVQNQVEDYYNYIQLANALLLPSREEPFGNVVIDAASLGKPIVASKEGGAARFIQPGMGELVSFSTPEHFIRGIQRVMNEYSAYDIDLLVRQSREYSTQVQVAKWQRRILAALDDTDHSKAVVSYE